MKKRIIALMLTGALAVTMLAGCGKKNETVSEPVKEETAEEKEEAEEAKEDEAQEPVDTQIATGDEEDYFGSDWCVSYYPTLFDVNENDDGSVIFTYKGECAGSCYVQFTDTGISTPREAVDSFVSTTEKTSESEINLGGRDGISLQINEDETTKSASGLEVHNSFIFLTANNGVLAIEIFETLNPEDEAAGYAISGAIEGLVDSIEFANDVADVMPSSPMEERIQKTEFTSYDEIIGYLEPGEAYGYAKVMGSDEEVLFITTGTFEDGGKNYAMEAYPYIKSADGSYYYCAGSLATDSTSTPIAVSKDGIIYIAQHDVIEKDVLEETQKTLMMMEYHYVSYDDNGDANGYGGFVREKNSFSVESRDYEGDDPYYFEKTFEEYNSCTPIAFTLVK